MTTKEEYTVSVCLTSLRRIGTTVFERSDGYRELIRKMVAREAKITYLGRN